MLFDSKYLEGIENGYEKSGKNYFHNFWRKLWDKGLHIELMDGKGLLQSERLQQPVRL